VKTENSDLTASYV